MAYVMKTMGIVTPISPLNFATISKTLFVVQPPSNALRLASIMTGPSAVGSEKGMPSSISDAPALTISTTHFAVVSRSGSPHVIKGMNALPFSNALAILLIDVLPSVTCDCSAVLVASAGDRDNHDLILRECRCELDRMSYRMC